MSACLSVNTGRLGKKGQDYYGQTLVKSTGRLGKEDAGVCMCAWKCKEAREGRC